MLNGSNNSKLIYANQTSELKALSKDRCSAKIPDKIGGSDSITQMESQVDTFSKLVTSNTSHGR